MLTKPEKTVAKKTGTQDLEESLQPGEYHIAVVTLDDGTKHTVRITADEGFHNQIVQHFSRQGKKVEDIEVDWSIQHV